MDGTPQNTPDPGTAPPPPSLYKQARDAGFSDDEIKAFNAKQPDKPAEPAPETPEPVAAPAPAPTPPAPTVPPQPVPTPGVYSPEQQQNALRAADAITDPEMRMKVKSHLKREYANDAMMDGITSKAREEGTKTAISSYSTAIEKLRDDPKMSLEQKRQLVQMLTKTMWQDPRTDYGETRMHLEGAMQTIAFGENTMNMGSGYIAGLDAIATGKINSARQILQMENQGSLTAKGYSNLISRFGTLDKPDKALDTRREALALKHLSGIIMKGFDEENLIPGMKPPAKFNDMVDKATQAFYDSIEAAGDDRAAQRKAMSLESVSALVDQVYPLDQRMADRISAGVYEGGVPPTVAKDERSQTAYKNYMANPPQITGKDGKTVPMAPATWGQAIEILRKTGQVDNFNAATHTKLGAPIYKALPYVAQPPTVAPVPTAKAAEAPGFFSGMLQRALHPPTVPGPDILKGVQESGNEAITKGAGAVEGALRKTLPVEAKK